MQKPERCPTNFRISLLVLLHTLVLMVYRFFVLVDGVYGVVLSATVDEHEDKKTTCTQLNEEVAGLQLGKK